MKRTSALVVCLLSAWTVRAEIQEKEKPDQVKKSVLPVIRPATARSQGGSLQKGTNGITYHGGPVILGRANAYYIWYGNWGGANAGSVTLLESLAHNIGGSPYYNINTTYYSGNGTKVSNAATLVTSTTDNYSHGASLSDMDVQAVVSSAITSGRLPNDPNGVYFVLTSADVDENSGFCTRYCGWHSYGNIAGGNIKYSFVGDAARCPSACAAQTSSPNGNPGADAMASIIAHELEESVTDPNLNAWYDYRGAENADKCAWTFGATRPASNASQYNMTLGGYQYLIQQNWVAAKGGYCALSY